MEGYGDGWILGLQLATEKGAVALTVTKKEIAVAEKGKRDGIKGFRPALERGRKRTPATSAMAVDSDQRCGGQCPSLEGSPEGHRTSISRRGGGRRAHSNREK